MEWSREICSDLNPPVQAAALCTVSERERFLQRQIRAGTCASSDPGWGLRRIFFQPVPN